MSGYNGRRAPNFSQYLDSLNAIPSPYDQAVQQQQQQDSFNIDAELALFTNTEFFDFDKLGDLNLPTTFDSDDSQKDTTANADRDSEVKFLDLLNNDGLANIPDYPQRDFNATDSQQNMQMQHNPFGGLPRLSTAPANTPVAPSQSSPESAPLSAGPTSASAPHDTPSPPATKRKSSSRRSTQLSVEEVARVAAEDDKRRRNTAASARFRVKKKLREQTLEKTVKETSDRNSTLEARVSQLELENRWLKNLITEKNGGESSDGKQSEMEIAEMFKKFVATRKTENEQRKSDSRILS